MPRRTKTNELTETQLPINPSRIEDIDFAMFKYINETLSDITDNNEDQDFFSAIKVCKKKRIGPARDENNRPLFRKKALGSLARSGFDFETSKRVLDIEKSEYLKIINLL